MRLLNQSCEAFVQEPGLDGIYKQIERAGRTCYKSTDKVTPESAKPFVDRMIKSNHTAMLEHGTVYLTITYNPENKEDRKLLGKYLENPYTKVVSKILESPDLNKPLSEQKIGETIRVTKAIAYITTNLRVIVENDLWDDLKYLCEPTEYHKKRYTLSCTTALHCYKDLTRHRVFSFAIESTRYCNYSKDKFGGELSFIIPTWFKQENNKYFKKTNTLPVCSPDEHFGGCLPEFYFKTGDDPIMEGMQDWTPEDYFMFNCLVSEWNYNHLIEEGWQAQQAAEVLPQCIKGDMIITGFEDDWKHLLDLRYYGTTGAPHPMVKELATLMKEELEKLGFNY